MDPTNLKSKSILCVFAHPDDESFGTGGTLAKYAATGTHITVVSATRGEGSTLGMDEHQEELGNVREAEMSCASQVLGLADSRVLRYPDTKLDQLPAGELRKLVSKLIDEVNPDVIIAFDPGGVTGNPDHIAMTQAATEAVNAIPLQHRPRLFYWVLPEDIASRMRELADIPFVGVDISEINVVIDTSDYVDLQWEAIRCHKSQSDPLPSVVTERIQLQAGHEYFVRAGDAKGAESVATDFFT